MDVMFFNGILEYGKLPVKKCTVSPDIFTTTPYLLGRERRREDREILLMRVNN